VVVTFLALLELIKAATLELVQTEPFAPIHVRMRENDGGALALTDDVDDWDSDEPAES
jgi:segregation and condensation protein A